MQLPSPKIRNKVAVIVLSGFFSFSFLKGTSFITQCFGSNRIRYRSCVDVFLERADSSEKMLYYIFIGLGFLFGGIALYSFYKLKQDPEAVAVLSQKPTLEDIAKRKKQMIRGYLWAIPILAFIMIIAYYYVRPE